MRRLIAVILLLMMSAGVVAQSDTPDALIGSVEAGDFQALTVTADERHLLVADAANQQVRIYSLADLSNPVLVSAVGVENNPQALVAARDIVMVSTQLDGDATTLEIIAPTRYTNAEPFVSGVNYIDLPFTVVGISVSPNLDIALAYGVDQYTILEIDSADDIATQGFALDLSHAFLTQDALIYAQGDQLSSLRLSDNSVTATLTLEDTPQALVRSADGQIGAAALGDGQIVIFETDSLNLVDTVTVPGAIPLMLAFGTTNGDQILTVVLDDARTMAFIAVTAGNVQVLEARIAMENPIQAITTFGDHLIATDGTQISIFNLPR